MHSGSWACLVSFIPHTLGRVGGPVLLSLAASPVFIFLALLLFRVSAADDLKGF